MLERRPKAESFTVEDLVQEVLDGRLRVPKFQRGLRWDASDVEQLLDSIYRGYPIGSLLFWVRQGSAQRIEYGTLTVDAPDMSEAWWVVDGQQRLNALVRALAGTGFPQEKFALYFDLHKQKFVRPQPRDELPEHWLPLTEVVDSERLMNWILEHPDVDRALAITVGKRIREYNVPAYLVMTEDEDAVREIFARLNSTGKRMQDSEVFSALYGARHAGSPADVREVAASLGELGFGTLDPDQLHSMMLATRGIDISKPRVLELGAEDARAALADLERAGRSVIQFLRETAKIPHIALLPYALPLVVLTRFFQYFPHVHPRNRELLSRWLWRGAISGQHQGNTTSVRAALMAIREGDEHQSVQNLLAMLGRWAAPKELLSRDLDGFRFRAARSKLQSLALWSIHPRHLEDRSTITIGADASELFPPARITSGLQDGLLANRMIHPRLGVGTMERALCEVEDEGVLASHAMDTAMVVALRDGQWFMFRRLREVRLSQIIERLCDRMAEPEATDRPPLDALIINDEGVPHGDRC